MYKDLVKDKTFYSMDIPQTLVPRPTDDDYQKEFIQRFFVQKANDLNGFVYEVNSETFDVLKSNPFWITTTIRWRISGPLDNVYDSNGLITDKGVTNSNKASISMGAQTINNIGLYLPNVLQFYKS